MENVTPFHLISISAVYKTSADHAFMIFAHDLPPTAIQLVTAFIGGLQWTFLSAGVVNLSSNPPCKLMYIPKLIISCYSLALLFPFSCSTIKKTHCLVVTVSLI